MTKRTEISQALDIVYEEADALLVEYFKRHNLKVACKPGCNSCCMLLAIITISDGVYLAEEVLSRDDWRTRLQEIRKAAGDHCYIGIDKQNWFARKQQCVFLKDGACSVYKKRPSACRFHYVLSPPEDCHPDSKKGTWNVDLRHFEMETSWKISMAIAGLPLCAPIPLMVLSCMELLVQQGFHTDKKDEVLKAKEGIPNPNQWMELHAKEFLGSEMEKLKLSLGVKQNEGHPSNQLPSNTSNVK